MKASKFIVLAGGILGILAFFLPMVSVNRADYTGTVSAFQLMKGLDTIAVHAGGEEVNVAMASAGASAAEAKDAINGMKGIVMAIFAPAILLLLIGGLGVARKKFGRVAGAFSLIFGLIGLGIGGILKSAAEGDSGSFDIACDSSSSATSRECSASCKTKSAFPIWVRVSK